MGFDAFTDPAKKLERFAREDEAEAAREQLAIIVALAARISAPSGPSPARLRTADWVSAAPASVSAICCAV